MINLNILENFIWGYLKKNSKRKKNYHHKKHSLISKLKKKI